MRAPIAYYMIILYCTVMFKPLIPIVKDMLAHTFAEAIHIATVHAIYGANHLQKEVDQTGSDNTGNKHQSSNTEDQVQVHVSANVCKYNFGNMITSNKFPFYKYCEIIPGFVSKHSPPPKFGRSKI